MAPIMNRRGERGKPCQGEASHSRGTARCDAHCYYYYSSRHKRGNERARARVDAVDVSGRRRFSPARPLPGCRRAAALPRDLTSGTARAAAAAPCERASEGAVRLLNGNDSNRRAPRSCQDGKECERRDARFPVRLSFRSCAKF